MCSYTTITAIHILRSQHPLTHTIPFPQSEMHAECLVCQSRFSPAVAHMESPPEDYDNFFNLEKRLLTSPSELRAARTYADKLWRELQVW